MPSIHSVFAALCTHDPTLDILTDNNLPQCFACQDSLTVMRSTIHLADSTFRCSACLLKLPKCQDGVLKSFPAMYNVCMHAQGCFTVSHQHAALLSCTVLGHSIQTADGMRYESLTCNLMCPKCYLQCRTC